MPVYTYKCDKCGEFEFTKGINEPNLEKCPRCNSEVSRVFKPSNVTWKCDGSYSKINAG